MPPGKTVLLSSVARGPTSRARLLNSMTRLMRAGREDGKTENKKKKGTRGGKQRAVSPQRQFMSTVVGGPGVWTSSTATLLSELSAMMGHLSFQSSSGSGQGGGGQMLLNETSVGRPSTAAGTTDSAGNNSGVRNSPTATLGGSGGGNHASPNGAESASSTPGVGPSPAVDATATTHTLHPFFGQSIRSTQKNNLVLRNGAYGIPKARDVDTAATPDVDDGVAYLSTSVGEDAYFIRPDALGIADGVGGLSHYAGTNSSKWSRRLMHHCCFELNRYENVDDDKFLEYYEVSPLHVLQTAYEESMAEARAEGLIGSSTGLLAVLRRDELRVANLGDGWCGVIRGDGFVFNMPDHQHKFNHPFQVGPTSSDTPLKDGRAYSVKVQKDDIVILCSDGLVDNLFDEDILDEVMRYVRRCPLRSSGNSKLKYALSHLSPQELSEALCTRARCVYEDERVINSPFQYHAMENGVYFVGGKPDDITTLVAVVGELESSADRNKNV